MTKREREAAFRATLFDVAKRVGAGIRDVAKAPHVLPAMAGAGFGALSLWPQSIDPVGDPIILEDEQIFSPSDPVALEECKRGCDNIPPGEAQWACKRACEAKYGGALLAVRYRWRFGFRVLALLHTLVPNIGIPATEAISIPTPWPLPDITVPATPGWNMRDAMALYMVKESSALVRVRPDGMVHTEDVKAARDAAIVTAKRLIQQDLLLIGLMGGAGGLSMLTELLKGTGEVLKGIGEIVPL